MKEVIDISDLDAKDQKIVQKVTQLIKENNALREILKEISKLI